MVTQKRRPVYDVTQAGQLLLSFDPDGQRALSPDLMREGKTSGYADYGKYVANITESGLSIYDRIDIGNPDLWIPTTALETILHDALVGLSLAGLPLRTRSKKLKASVCQALGYPVPTRFTKTQPRFPGQNFDTYIQKSDNLQIWNEEVIPTRRYVLIRLSPDDVVQKVKVVTGVVLAHLDQTGTLTQKYQARVLEGAVDVDLLTSGDTPNVEFLLGKEPYLQHTAENPIDWPSPGSLLPIAMIFHRLSSLVGQVFMDAGYDQERNRGAALHRLVCQQLGYTDYRDAGQFPDVPNQLLEVKLQTSSTIDLGLVRPDSEEPLGMPRLGGVSIRHCDVRYAVFSGRTDGKTVAITHLYMITGQAFFGRFPQCMGREINTKIQIPLPSDFFED
jgi:hypothetical protein